MFYRIILHSRAATISVLRQFIRAGIAPLRDGRVGLSLSNIREGVPEGVPALKYNKLKSESPYLPVMQWSNPGSYKQPYNGYSSTAAHC